MIGNGNNRINNINDLVNRRPQQYQDINDLGENVALKPNFYQNAFNMNKINQSGNNSMNKQNVRMNRNMNMNININRIINKNNLNNMNNLNSMNNLNNMNVNKNNMNNNKIRNIQNMTIQNNNINKALMVLRNEFKKKDDRIRALELKVAELENKINMITNSGNYQLSESNINNNNSNIINITKKKIGKNFTFADKYSEEINPNYIKRDSLNKTPEINYGRENNPFRNKDDNQNINNNFYNQTQSANQYKIKQKSSDNEYIMENKNSNNNNINNNININQNDVQVEGSTYTGNSGSFQRHSKNDVKIFLKEVKSKVAPPIFKEFIQNIKLLTNSKDKNNDIDKATVIEKVRMLFGEQFKDLFIKFESIIGITN